MCPCGSGHAFSTCCAPYLSGAATPPTAEALMRSRYTAFTLQNAAYLKATWHPSTRPANLNLTDQADTKWLGLTIKHHEVIDADHARVEFVARYKLNGRAHRLHEISRFERIEERWLYVDGDLR
ncbi:MAG: YchJ family metal-binding protein [Pseudomonadota bacterium]